jgi:replicative DNA helicase
MRKRKKDILPSAPNAERALLGMAMKYPETQERLVRESPTEEMFFNKGNRELFRIIRDLYTARAAKGLAPKKITPRSIFLSDKHQGKVDEIGGPEFLAIISKITDEPENFDFHMRVLRLRWLQREKIRIHQGAAKELLTYDGDSIDSILQLGLKESDELMTQIGRRRSSGPVCIRKEGVKDMLDKIHSHDRSVAPVFSGKKILDEKIFGFWPGRLYVVVARPKIGKSSLLTDIAVSMAIRGVEENEGVLPIVYVDTETEPDSFSVRVLSNLSGIDSNYIMSDKFRSSKGDKASISRAMKQLDDSGLFWIRDQFMKIDRAIGEVRGLSWSHDIRAIFYDQIKIPDVEGLEGAKEYQALGYMTTALKELAEEMNVPVIAAAHTSRGDSPIVAKAAAKGETVDPTGVIADSDRILRYCSVVAHLRRLNWFEIEANGGVDNGNCMLSLIANRHGDAHDYFEGIMMRSNLHCARFTEVEETSIAFNKEASDGEDDIL